MKAVRYVAYAIVGLLVLAIAAVAIAIAVIDPNTYKPQIERAVESKTNLDLILTGDIGWSFIPLGLELNNVEATLDDQRLVKLDQLVAQVSFWSLVTMSPRVDTFVLDGLDARLVVDKDGTGNWTRIMPEGAPTSEDAQQATEVPPTEDVAESGEREPLNFNVESVRISNAQVHYDDQSTGQSLTLEDFALNASDITLGQSFPLDMSFRFATGQPEFTVDGSISAHLAANEALNEFSVSGLDGQFDLSGEPFGNETVQARIAGSLDANLENKIATLTRFSASLADFKLNTDLNVAGFGDKPQLEGSLSIERFSLKKLLETLGQPAIETDDPEVLKAIAFSTSIGGPAGTVELSDMTISLDDTTFQGSASYGVADGAIGLKLQGDEINVDRYLPPASEDDQAAASTQTAQGSGTASGTVEETDLLPLETLRELILDVDLGLGQLIVSNLTINEVKSSITARNGVLKVTDFSGKLYYGTFGATATLDARTDNPKWTVSSKVNNVQIQPLLTDLAELDMISGGANLSVDVNSNGNRISTLRDNAKGNIGFNLAEGEFTRMNLTRMACQGIALVNQESLGTTDWGTGTPFNDMRGTLKIDGNTLRNNDLVAALAGMRLEGDGTVDLSAATTNYEAGLRIVGELHRDEACRVTEYVQDVVIPVECRGSLDDPAGLCSFDGSRFRDTLKDVAANAARAKVREETDRAKKKAEEKAKEELEKRLGDEGKNVKDALKGLFD